MAINLQEIKKILIIQYQPFGDVLLNTGYLPALRKKFPDAKIDFLVRHPFETVLLNNPNLDELVVFKNGKGLNYFADRIKLIRMIRYRNYDCIIDQIRSTGSAQITLFSRAKYRLGFADRRWKSFYNYTTDRDNIRYYSALKFDVLKPLGIKEEPHKLFFHIKDESVVFIKKWLEENNLESKKFIGISPGTPVVAKKWNLNNYARLADKLVKETGYQVVLIWGPGEKGDSETVAKFMEETAILAPETDFNQVAALLRECALLICNDGGLNHLSVATGTPSIAIFGKHNPQRWSPVIFENHFHFHKENNNYKNDDTFGITSKEVYDKAADVLRKLESGVGSLHSAEGKRK